MQPNVNLIKGIAWMIGSLTSFTLMTVSVRELGGDMHPFQILFIRSTIGILILLPIITHFGKGRPEGGWRQIRRRFLAGHTLRNIIHFTGQVLWILGVGLLPLATVSAIEFTSPLWGGLLAVLFLGERINRGRLAAFTLGFVGILIIVRPGFIEISDGILIMLTCAFFFGATGAITKWLTRRETTLAITFYMVTMQAAFGGVASVFVWEPVLLEHLPWLLLVGVSGLSAHFCLTSALATADATFVMPIDFLRLPLVALVGYLVYAEAFEMDILLGALIIFSGNYISLRYETRRGRPPQPPAAPPSTGNTVV